MRRIKVSICVIRTMDTHVEVDMIKWLICILRGHYFDKHIITSLYTYSEHGFNTKTLCSRCKKFKTKAGDDYERKIESGDRQSAKRIG